MSTNASKFSLVRIISEFLKLGDDGKLDSFFTRVIKSLKKEAEGIKRNLENLKFNHEQKLEELEDQLQDAQTAFDESYLKVDLERIGTNEAQKDFQETYLDNIDNHAIKVKTVEKLIENEKESYEAKKKGFEEQIESLNKRITKISAEDTATSK